MKAKAKREAEATEGIRPWDEAEEREKAKIARIDAKASERSKIKGEVRSIFKSLFHKDSSRTDRR